MVATLKNSFYLCGVKSNERYEAAAQKLRFLCPLGSIKISARSGCTVMSPRISARLILTAPIALSLLSN
jgi:hypothetical protein